MSCSAAPAGEGGAFTLLPTDAQADE
jgi:hypothetical protein